MKEVFTQHCGAYPGLTYHRIPLPDFCAPCEQVRALCGLGLWGARGGPLPPPPVAWASAVGAAPRRDWELVPCGSSLPSERRVCSVCTHLCVYYVL